MSKQTKFKLVNESLNLNLGTITFNGKFVFELDKNISHELWNSIGFIPMENGQSTAESVDLFYYLNSRLPMNLRKKTPKSKLDYIKDSGLRVVSDSFVLLPL